MQRSNKLGFFELRDILRMRPGCWGVRGDITTQYFLAYYPEEDVFEYADWNGPHTCELTIEDIQSYGWEIWDEEYL